jgi:hypothetical protein
MAFPVIALVVVGSLASGGVTGLLHGIDGTIRQTAAAVVQFIADLF